MQINKRILIISVVIVAIVGAALISTRPKKLPTSTNTPYTAPTILCDPEDVQQCPDGTFIHRELPDCKPVTCPTK